jgi:hypothetical protein
LLSRVTVIVSIDSAAADTILAIDKLDQGEDADQQQTSDKQTNGYPAYATSHPFYHCTNEVQSDY